MYNSTKYFIFIILCFYSWENWFLLNLSLKSCNSWVTVKALSFVECMLNPLPANVENMVSSE
jgi:hypothetical protein